MWGSSGPIRLQHKWKMTTSFTCSTGLGDKLVPLLLPGMFCLLFGRFRRESCVLQMMTGGIKAARRDIASPVQAAEERETEWEREMCVLAFRRALTRHREVHTGWMWNRPCHASPVDFTEVNLKLIVFSTPPQTSLSRNNGYLSHLRLQWWCDQQHWKVKLPDQIQE